MFETFPLSETAASRFSRGRELEQEERDLARRPIGFEVLTQEI